MSRPHIRDFHGDDLDQLVGLWTEANGGDASPVYSLAEVIASCQADHAVVAVDGPRLLGAAVGRAAHAQGWIVFFAVTDDDADGSIASGLLDALERRMASLGLAKLSMLVPEELGIDTFTNNSFAVHHSVRYLEREMPVQRRELDALKELGGRVLPRNLWRRVAGMTREKTILEERLVTPLARPDLAERFGVVPPRAVMLFGPPGTGKTTFARAVASRLRRCRRWPSSRPPPGSTCPPQPGASTSGASRPSRSCARASPPASTSASDRTCSTRPCCPRASRRRPSCRTTAARRSRGRRARTTARR